jgi:hypothetical protein
MNVNELRIGNLLRDKTTGSLLKVNELSDAGYGFKVVEWLKEVNGEIKRSEIKPEPIPITGDILTGSEFMPYPNPNNTGSFIYEICGFKLLYSKVYGYRLMGMDGIVPIYIIYIHQLQNTYFILMGLELEINI